MVILQNCDFASITLLLHSTGRRQIHALSTSTVALWINVAKCLGQARDASRENYNHTVILIMHLRRKVIITVFKIFCPAVIVIKIPPP